MSTGHRNDTLGRHGEAVALRHLLDQGMVLVERNWICAQGELDLVMRAGDTLVVCEVKTRSSARHGHPLEAIDDDKLGRVRRLADLWCEARGVRPAEIRVDLVGVIRPPKGKSIVEHVPGVC